MKRLLSLFLAAAMLLSTGACGTATEESSAPTESSTPENSAAIADIAAEGDYENAVYIRSTEEGDIDWKVPESYNSPVSLDHDIVYYEEGKDFTYGEGTEADEHSADEAAAHTVIHISEPGTYVLTGKLPLGQVAVDLGEEAETDPSAVVTLILDNFDITCTVAPAIIFYNVYECGDKDSPTAEVDTTAAGANVIIADGSINNVSGSYVARIYKSVELNDEGTEVVDSKKLHKYDAAFYSKMTMNVGGEAENSGVLNITAENEGLDSELHLTINGGIINIESGNDGINTNEDGVSVTTINGGELNIICNGSTGEGDGIDSNGWLVINGGKVTAQACAVSGDAGIDSDMGIHINGGTVLATGNMLDRIAESESTYAVFQFAGKIEGGTNIALKNENNETVAEFCPDNSFSYLIMALPEMADGDYSLWAGEKQLSHGGTGDFGGMRPEGFTKPEGMELPEDFDPSKLTPPEGWEPPEDFDPSKITLPEGMELPEGFDPSTMTPPEGFGGRGENFGGNMTPGETSTVFTIVKGGNNFMGIAEAVEN